jgi:hypothetical protein
MPGALGWEQTCRKGQLNMKNLENHASSLSNDKRKTTLDLISDWDPEDVKSITNACRAVSGKPQTQFVVDFGIPAQALGKRVGAEFVKYLNKGSLGCPPRDCFGYSDQMFWRLKDGRPFMFELKTELSSERDNGSRMVLISANRKLRQQISPTKPICQLLATIYYEKSRVGRNCWVGISGVRLDFLRFVPGCVLRY